MRGEKIYGFSMVSVLVLLLLLLSAPALAGPPVGKSTSLGLNSIDKMKPNGEYLIEILMGDKWVEAGRLAYDKYVREREIDLGKFITGNEATKIRLTEKGGGAAHIDAVLLGNMPPTQAREFKVGAYCNTPLQKVSKKDYDVIDAFNKSLEFTFADAGKDKILRLTARVENEIIGTTPFQFPRPNLNRPMNEHSQFYRYQLDSEKGVLKLDGGLAEVSGQKPFFQEFSPTGSGHPSGITYGWVRNDETSLYVAIDFTADNTYDGDKDYAKVYVKTETGLKEFKVSVPETRWGMPDFTYTDKVAYQHKVYKFKIPLKELGLAPAAQPRELQLAFAAYGTSCYGETNPALAYDSLNNRYLAVYSNKDDVSCVTGFWNILGQLMNADGTTFGPELVISDAAANGQYSPSVAYDSFNHRFLVVWRDSRSSTNGNIYGQLVNANGTLFGTASNVNFVISNATTEYQFSPVVAYDSFNHRYLVAWEDWRSGMNIYGQLVNAGGTLFGTASNVNFVISNATGNQSSPSVSYDSFNHRYLVVWVDSRNGNNDIYGQLVNPGGALYSTASNVNFVISNAADTQSYPSIAYDSTNHRFLAVWQDHRSGTSDDIYGQLVNANGTLNGTDFVVCDETHDQYVPSVAYDSAHQWFLVAWQDTRNATYDIYGQLIDPNGIPLGTNFVIANAPAPSYQYNPVVAYNSFCANFLVAYEDVESGVGVPDIAFTPVGLCAFSSCVVDTSGLVAWWQAEGNPNDAVGTNHGTLVNGATFAPGLVGRAFKFEGSDEYISAPLATTNVDNITLDAWVYWGGANLANSNQLIFYQGDSGYNGYGLFVRSTDGHILLCLGGVGVFDNNIALATNTWQHLVLVHIGSGNWNLYLDGVIGSVMPPWGTIVPVGNMLIGGKTGGVESFNGLIDEVEIFTRAITEGEITALYNSGAAGKCPLPETNPTILMVAPNGGEVIPAGSTYPLHWKTPGTVDHFKLHYTFDNGLTWNLIADNVHSTYFNWPVPAPGNNNTQGKVRVIGQKANHVEIGRDASNAVFTTEVVKLTSPSDPGILRHPGESLAIMWNTNATKLTVDKVMLDYSTDNGATWKAIDTLYSNPGTYAWGVPAQAGNKTQCRARVRLFNGTTLVGSDRSDNPFTIQVLKLTYPNGGEIFDHLDALTITWDPYDVKGTVAKYTISYTKDGGATWSVITTQNGNPNPGTWGFWDVPAVLADKTQCKVKIALKDAAGNVLASDVSDGFFTIQYLP